MLKNKINKEKKRYPKIFFLNPHGIGDVVMTIPLLRGLRKGFPNAYIMAGIQSVSIQLILKNENLADDFVIINRKRQSILDIISCAFSLHKIKFDLAVVPIITFPAIRSSLFVKSLCIPVRVGQRDNLINRLLYTKGIENPYKSEHKVETNLRILKALNLRVVEKFPRLFINEKHMEFAKKQLKVFKNSNIIGIAPGSGRIKVKRWPIIKYKELVSKLVSDNFNCIILGNKEEAELGKYISHVHSNRVKDFMGKTTILQAMALIKECKLLVCNDNSLGHLGTALGISTLGIFGPTNPFRIAPYGRNFAYVQNKKSCVPCYEEKYPWKDLEIACGNPECITKIEVNDVYNKTLEILNVS